MRYFVVVVCYHMWFLFFFKQKTAYEMRISDWSSDVCSSDLNGRRRGADAGLVRHQAVLHRQVEVDAHQRHLAVHVAQVVKGLESAHRSIQIGRASCRASVCQYVEISLAAVTLKKKVNEIHAA